MKIQYTNLKMRKQNRDKLAVVNKIVEGFQAEGYVLTLRQLYYQLVKSNIIPNKHTEYKKLGTLLKEGRMAGIVDWDAIEDRLRVPKIPYWYDDPEDAINDAIENYRIDRQKNQSNYIEVWIEKDALSSVVERVTQPYHIRLLVCRGYSSASAMHRAYKRFKRANMRGQSVKLLYLGDFDPSGEDMVRDIDERMQTFSHGESFGLDFEIEKIALNKDQIRKYKPPPNPVKLSDSRAQDFILMHGKNSWELDSLEPKVLNGLLEGRIKELIDLSSFREQKRQEQEDIETLQELAKNLD